MDKLPKRGANYVPLSPVIFLERAANVYADRTSIIYRNTSFTWKQTYERCRRLASSLASLNLISKNHVVSVLAPNIPALYEMHFAVPMAGAVLNAINTRLDARGVATILSHSEAKVFFVDHQYLRLAVDALHLLVHGHPPLVVVIDDVDSPTGTSIGELEYEGLISAADPDRISSRFLLDDEWDPISLNYTSGTTAAPKGVVYSHRGAYLSTLTLLLQWGVRAFPVYLWSLPMFHCNGWTFTWGVAARGGTNVCIRSTSASEMYRAISAHHVTHMCCAPVVFNILLDAKPEDRHAAPKTVDVLTGGSPPHAAQLERMEQLGFHVTHAYGLTEATGPALFCEWQPDWDGLPAAERARLKARQGVSTLTLVGAEVRDAKTMAAVPRDGRTVGEIVLRGSSVMKGYYKNEEETSKAFKDGWFVTGDVGAVHPDGYIEIKDRSKDIIISGGENISSVEVETVLFRHPKVVEAAVVAMPHPRWGETPCAFVVARGGGEKLTEEEVVRHCRRNMAMFMVPKKVVFVEELPKLGTGKVTKAQLRERAKGFKVSESDGTPAGGRVDDGQRRCRQEQIMATSRL